MRKIKVGISIDEILRAKWLQFDRYYVQEFGEDGVPDNPYVYDFFNNYKFNDIVEKIKELKEPEDTPDDINPIYYEVDKKTGEAPADVFLFKKEQEVKLNAKEVYNRFMYEDFLFEIHGAAPAMYKNIDLDINKLIKKYESRVDFHVLSVENWFTIPPTLFFLSKISCRFKNYRFVDKSMDMWNDIDVLITSDPVILELGVPWGKKLIKVNRPYNENIKKCSFEIIQIKELIDNPQFEKIIKYKK